MKTAIVYYSCHHGNIKKLVDAIALQFDVDLINVCESNIKDLSNYDCIGFASGIYFSSFAKQVLSFTENICQKTKMYFL